MALEKKELLSLMKAAAQATSTKNYSYKGEEMTAYALNAALRDELKELAGDYNSYRRNKNDLFELIEETIDFIVPKKISEAYAQFAETKTFAQGDRPVFKVKGLGRKRAKQFITRVGLAGIYETFKLSDTWFEVKTSAIGGAAEVGFEEFLDGRVDFAELIQLVMEGMDELIYKEVANAMISSINQLPAANRHATNGFDAAHMDRLVQIASAYGTPTIYCTREFAVRMIPEESYLSNNMKDTLWNEGYIGTFHGTRVVILPQTYEDETNERKVIDPGYAWVIPSDGNTKPVKIAFEGTMHMKDFEQDDWSRSIHFYQKVGVGVIMTNNICVYKDEALAGHLESTYVPSTTPPSSGGGTGSDTSGTGGNGTGSDESKD